VPSCSSHSLLTFLSSSQHFHNTSSSVPSTAVDIQHFLKPFTVTSGEMCYRAVMIYIDWIIHLYFLASKLTWTLDENSQYSPKIVLVVLRILKTCVLEFLLFLWSDQSEFMVLFMVFNLWIRSGFIFESGSYFLIFQQPFFCYYLWTRFIFWGTS
jgi:hypothetical protein